MYELLEGELQFCRNVEEDWAHCRTLEAFVGWDEWNLLTLEAGPSSFSGKCDSCGIFFHRRDVSRTICYGRKFQSLQLFCPNAWIWYSALAPPHPPKGVVKGAFSCPAQAAA